MGSTTEGPSEEELDEENVLDEDDYDAQFEEQPEVETAGTEDEDAPADADNQGEVAHAHAHHSGHPNDTNQDAEQLGSSEPANAAEISPKQNSHRGLKVVDEDVRKQISAYFEAAPAVLGSVLSFFEGADVRDDDLKEAVNQLPTLLAFFDADSNKQLGDDEKINLLSFMKLFAGDHIAMDTKLLQRMKKILAEFACAENKLSVQEQENLVKVLKDFAGGDAKLSDDELNKAEKVIKTFTSRDSKHCSPATQISIGIDVSVNGHRIPVK